MMAIVVLILVLLPHTVCTSPNVICNISGLLPILHKSHQPGKINIAAIMSQSFMFLSPKTFKELPSSKLIDDIIVFTQLYQHILALVFAVKEVNENPYILSNTTLGFSIYDGHFSAKSAYRASMDLVSTQKRFLPNYKCETHNNTVSVIGGPDSNSYVRMAPILALYKIPQITYGSVPVMDDSIEGVFIYHMFPNGDYQHTGILRLLQHFHWIWIGVIYFEDETGDWFVQNVLPVFSENGICIAFKQKFPKQDFSDKIEQIVDEGMKTFKMLMDSTAKVFIIHGQIIALLIVDILINFSRYEPVLIEPKGKVLLLTAQVDFTKHPVLRSGDISFLHGSISLAIHSKELSSFQKFLQTQNPIAKQDPFCRNFWENAFLCSFPNYTAHWNFEKTCTGEEKLKSLPSSVFEMSMTGHSYSVYNAVFAVAHALQFMESSQFRTRVMGKGQIHEIVNWQPWQLHHFLRYVSFNNSAGDKISFDQNGTLVTGFDIINWITFPNKSFMRIRVGTINPHAPHGNGFTISENDIIWPTYFNQVHPLSICNDNCHVGYHKRKKEGEPFCCYDCIPCPAGMISNETDMDTCFECPEGQYPSNDQHECIPKYIIFLSYNRPLGVSLTIISLTFIFITALVLGIFFKYRDTAIVKANNRSLSYVLLISLLLSFSCAFLFIGEPNHLICLLRDIAFNVIFSVALSCVLAKTITVILVFKATTSGSKTKKWMGKPLVNSIVFSCPLIKTIICIVCLIISPPFLDFDMQLMAKGILLDCDHDSALVFYSSVSTFGLLAIASFSVAFLARKLPDIFNEAKFITFSMVAFCSVWVTFIPAYLSTKGIYLITVEIFCILASGAALLIFIFSPKIYIILLKPELNNKKHLIRTKT
nr:vomeronasal type-2 receptor 26-like [Anolis sagrei ordinatus]